MLWTASDIATLTFGSLEGNTTWACNDLVLDGRQTKTGDLFVAVKGNALDGHDYLAQAAANGAVAALVEHSVPNAPLPLCVVRSTPKALEQLGAAARRRFTGKALAITGSVGKTTTKEMLLQALTASGSTQASRASYNNWLGVPFTLACLKPETRFGIFEVGMNHPFEITPLTSQIRPDMALVTWVAETHIENMGSLEAIAHAKAELFDGLPKDGVVMLPHDNPHYALLQKLAYSKSLNQVYGFGKDAPHTRLLDLKASADALFIEADILGEQVKTQLAMGGVHHVGNVLATLLAAKLLTGSAKQAAAALDGFGAITGRGQRHELADGIKLIDDSYNASPTAMIAAIESFGLEPKRRVAVLGDMRELGETARSFHESLAEPLLNSGVEALYICGPNMAYLAEKLGGKLPVVVWQPDSEALLPHVLSGLQTNDTVLVKGSLGSKMKRIVEALLKKKTEHAV